MLSSSLILAAATAAAAAAAAAATAAVATTTRTLHEMLFLYVITFKVFWPLVTASYGSLRLWVATF